MKRPCLRKMFLVGKRHLPMPGNKKMQGIVKTSRIDPYSVATVVTGESLIENRPSKGRADLECHSKGWGFYDAQENHGHFCVLTRGKINVILRRINLESHMQ